MPEIKNIISGRHSQRNDPWGGRSQVALDQLVARAQRQLGRDWHKTINRRPIRHDRDATTVTSSWWLRQGKGIDLWINPSSMQWQLPQRATYTKTLAGGTTNYWGNAFRKISGAGRFYDEGTIGMTFQTGSILPSVAFDNSELQTVDKVAQAVASPRVPPGLLNFYRFLELYDQPALLGAQTNYHIIQHHSRVFPDITLYGRFAPEGINFSEVATDGNTLQFEATFNVYRSVPRWSSASQLEATYIRFIRESGSIEQLGEESLDLYHYAEGVSDIPGKPPVGPPKQRETAPKVATSKAKREDIAASAKDGQPGVTYLSESAQAAEDIGDAYM